MVLSPFRWLIRNLGLLLLALVLAFIVWISAVTAADPNVERLRTLPLEVEGMDPNMIPVGTVPREVLVILESPRSVWDRVGNNENSVSAYVDMTGLGPGVHTLEVQVRESEDFHPVRMVQINPARVTVTLEPLITETLPVNLEITGDPSQGYEMRTPESSPEFVSVSGPQSLVSQVREVQASLDITDATETIKTKLLLRALDTDGQPLNGVTITPSDMTVTVPISLLGGYRNVVVRVVTIGQVAFGYKLTGISVSPPNVIVFSTDPQLVNELLSFVETEPLDLTDAQDDIETRLTLNLPPGISVTGDQTVLVQVSIAAIEGSLRITAPVRAIGLAQGLAAEVAPSNVDLILSGPIPVLNALKPVDVRVIVDVSGLEVGTHQIPLTVDVVPERVTVESILPSIAEVTIAIAATPTTTAVPAPGATAQP